MKNFHVCIVVTFLSRIRHTVATSVQSCDVDADSLMRRGIALEDVPFWTATAINEVECAKHCIKRKICKSFNFDTELNLCELNDGKLLEDSTPKTGANLRYSDISVWPSQIEPNCYDRPCGDDEVCIPTQFNGGTSCSHACLRMSSRCPLPEGIHSDQPRTVGSTLQFTCDRGFVGGDSAVCLTSGTWDKDIDTTCRPLYGSACKTDDECYPINGSCLQGTCQCNEPFVYDEDAMHCAKGCETDWVQFDDKCYLFSQAEMSYPEAMTYCENYGSALVQVDNPSENEFLRDIMDNTDPTPSTGYWNDLFQMTTHGNEIWRTTGNALTFSDWSPGNPDDYGGPESCTVFSTSSDYHWEDISCENSVRKDGRRGLYPPSRAVCEKYL